MLDAKYPEITSYANLETSEIPNGLEAVADSYAKELVLQNFSSYESFRTVNHDSRWTAQDALYVGHMALRVWPGTTIRRASLSYPLVFDQIESAQPAIYQALFSNPDWFSTEAMPGSPIKDARVIQDNLSYVLENAKDKFGSTALNEIDLAVKDILLRGNGHLALEWDPISKQPLVTFVDIRDLYIDSGLSTPNVEEARSIIRRKMMTIKELQDMRNIPGIKIPGDEYLYGISRSTPAAPADSTKQVQEGLRGVNYYPNSTDYPAAPVDRKIEVLIYYDKQRIIWLLNRQWIVYNQRNPYGFLPFVSAPCYIYPGRYYAMSVADIQEDNQRYIEALINGRLDQVHLSLEPPRVMNRSVNAIQGNNRWHPNKILMVDAEKDLQLLKVENVLPNVYSEIEFMQQASERRTGITGFSMGTPTSGNISRTATGVQAQSSGGSTRLLYIVKNIENYMLIPLLYKLYHMIRLHTGAYDELLARNSNGDIYTFPASVFGAKVNFRMLASSKMLTKDKLIQLFPFVFQYLLNGPMMQQLQTTGQTIDYAELLRFMQDATGTGRLYSLIRQMSPQEIQALQQQAQQAQRMEMQKTQQAEQVRLKISQEKNQTAIQTELIKKQKDPMELQMEQERAAREMAIKEQENRMKLAFEQQLNFIKLNAKREEAAQNLRVKQFESQAKAAEQERRTQLTQYGEIIKSRIEEEKMRRKLENYTISNNQKLLFEKESNDMQINMARLNAKQKPDKPKKKAN
jgi:hypothetical protein